MPETELYDSFRKIFLELYPSLCTYVNSIVQEASDAEDIVQETFLKIWQQKKDLVAKPELKYYLFTAVRNNAFSFVEKRSKNKIVELNADHSVADKEEKLPTTDVQALVNEALATLPPKCREVFILSRLNELKYAEIAETLNISIKTVENQMGKALRLLRTFYKSKQGLEAIILFILLNPK